MSRSFRQAAVCSVAVAVVLSALAVPLQAETYNITVRRIDKDLYQDRSSRTLIETRYCYEYAYSDEAVLRWESRYATNWIVFSSGTKCDMIAVFSRGR